MSEKTERDLRQIREEASPLSVGTKDQRQAIARITDALDALAVGGPPVEPLVRRTAKPPFGQMDLVRHNQCFLIEGERGSGKTATLVTLIHQLNERLAHRTATADQGAIVVLPMIDVRPFPPGRSLLPVLTNAFEPVLVWLEDEGICDAAKDGVDLRRTWDQLMRAATLGWSATPPLTASGDTAAAQIDLHEVERARASLLPKLKEFLDAACRAVNRHGRTWERPLFVIPIDDVDMNPAVTVQVVDLVRTLYHPRLAFVLTAHLALLEHCMKTAVVREFSGHSGDGSTHSVVGNLAQQHLTKILSGAFSLPALAPAERVDVLTRQGISRPANLEPEALGRMLPPHLRGLVDLARQLPEEPTREDIVYNSWRAASAGLSATDALTREEGGPIALAPNRLIPRWRVEHTRSTDGEPVDLWVATRVELVVADSGVPKQVDATAGRISLPTGRRPETPLPIAAGYAALAALGPNERSQSAALFRDKIRECALVGARVARTGLEVIWPMPRWETLAEAARFLELLVAHARAIDTTDTNKLKPAILSAVLRAVLETVDVHPPEGTTIPGLLTFVVEPTVHPVIQRWVAQDLGLLAQFEAGLRPEDANCINRMLPMDPSFDVVARTKAWVGVQQESRFSAVTPEDRRGFSATVDLRSGSDANWESFVRELQEVTRDPRHEVFTELRRGIFESLSGRDRSALMTEVTRARRLRRGRKGMAQLLYELWTRYAARLPSFAMVALDDAGRLVVSPALQLEPELGGEKVLRLPLSSVELRRVDIASTIDGSDPPSALHATLDLLYRLAWDEMVRSAAVSTEPSPWRPADVQVMRIGEEPSRTRVTFGGVQAKVGNKGTHWFAPPGRTVEFWERLVYYWNEIAEEIDPQRRPEEQQRLLDFLAVWWVGSFGQGPMQFQLPDTELAEYAKTRLLGALVPGDERRWDETMLFEFANRAPGISDSARAIILTAAE